LSRPGICAGLIAPPPPRCRAAKPDKSLQNGRKLFRALRVAPLIFMTAVDNEEQTRNETLAAAECESRMPLIGCARDFLLH
jgi:hypothetical protein